MIAPLLLALATVAPAAPPAVVTVAEPDELRVVAGGRAEARLVVTIEEGFKIQANPASNPFLVPATLELEADARVRLGAPEYPPGKPYRLPGAASDLSIYEGTFVIRVPLHASGVAPEGAASDVVLEGKLRFQACNRERCLRPSSVAVRVPVKIAPAAASAH